MKAEGGKNPQLLVISVLLAAIVGLLAVLVLMLSAGSSQQAPESSGSVAPSSAAGAEDLSALKVTPGQGGSRVSEFDGVTQVGYQPTCKGAVEAATNYLSDLDPSRMTSGRVSLEQFQKLYEERTRGKILEFAEKLPRFKAMFPNGTALVIYHPEWGGFKVNSCIPGKSASIAIYFAKGEDAKGIFYYFPLIRHLVWENGDWRLSGVDSVSGFEITNEPNGVKEKDERVYQEVVQNDGWTHYQDPAK
ncbi:hypothetical protein KRX56_01630 [Dermabacteraceae bacterium TAE3-ERU27]|nr:hypothetical protein [Dermabacteraceae bacterium TAE3-ERU27]